MSTTTKDDGKKWIQASIAVVCILLCYVLIRFFLQMGEWFELESKINNFNAITQVISVLIAGGVFFYIMKNPKTSDFLAEVYQEAVKVVWPDKNETVKHTIGIMIGVTIVGFLLGIFDWVAKWLLAMIN
ncbi:MAG: preprotein translocase subunit SecE [Halobacteriovoraceae bacterium]|nr:preprotein translocase subunit SecE [Halobacteriovoraceae bacterium]|tara:strand:- start:2916 stop:3302 length:387 start_codon:yes stop_codon:yes gene_type:complete